jgi:tripartite ATP-independent transporter DctP family solute receptor
VSTSPVSPSPAGASSPAPRWRGRQFHYQPVQSHVHPFLVDLWEAVREETDGRLHVEVFADNGGLKKSHLQIVDDVIAGDIQFYALMGSILGPVAPAMNVQSLPFAFRSSDEVHRTMDGPLGDLLRADLAARGLMLMPGGLMEDGFRHIATTNRPVHHVDDLAGLAIRIPEGKVFEDTFRELGAEPVPLFVLELYDALKTGRIQAQENPLAIIDSLKLHEVTRYVSMTSHMWSGFNLVGNPAFWAGLPEDVQQVVLRNVAKHVGRQRRHTHALNAELATSLQQRGMVFNTADAASFRARLAGGFYRRWKDELGRRVWDLLEAEVGTLS